MTSSCAANQSLACRVALVTPVGRSAVATIVVVGCDAVLMIAPLFSSASRRPLSEIPVGQIAFGRWANCDGSAEELVICRRSAERIEIHCHGGAAAARTILDSLVTRGGCEITWPEMLAAECGHVLEFEARIALANARTERTAAILLDQLHGALQRAFDQVGQHLQSGDLVVARSLLQTLLQRGEVGLHLTRPWRVVLAGLPNVGKSSLINALLGYERSIVFDQPGTTRDVVTATTVLDGWPIELADTAGLRSTADEIESQGVARARDELAAADLLLLVFDARSAGGNAMTADATVLVPPNTLVVTNKCDLVDSAAVKSLPGINTSATTGVGIDQLITAIVQKLVPNPPAPGDAVPFTAEQVELIASLLRLLDSAERERSIAAAIASLSLYQSNSPCVTITA